MNSIRSLAVLALLGALPLLAQTPPGLAGVVTPSSAAPGQTITLEVTAYGGPIGLSLLGGSNPIREVYASMPNGTCTWCPFGFTSPVTLNPGQSAIGTWDQTDGNGRQVPPGDYFLRVATWGQSTWFPVRVEAPTAEPTLSANQLVPQGAALDIDLSNATPGAVYLAAASFTTNTGIPLPGTGHIALDFNDPLFMLTWPNPLPQLTSNFQGNADGNGDATLTIAVPNAPFLTDVGFHVQAVTIVPGNEMLTNAIGFRIL